ncbi:MAG: STAS domain-containing protein [Candidatus Riflebacteria bacterium]|nr:STAS domain-containing protein [Candidatus Riflebacteria bacterium]
MPVVLECNFDAERGLVKGEVKYGHGGYRTVELDALVSFDLVRSLEALGTADCPRVLLDLARVTVLDSATLWTLVELGRRLAWRGGGLALLGLGAPQLELLELTGNRGVARPFDSPEEAALALCGR